jgi:hypothetical protein
MEANTSFTASSSVIGPSILTSFVIMEKIGHHPEVMTLR